MVLDDRSTVEQASLENKQLLSDGITLVTGSSRGIGAAIAKTLIAAGLHVIVNYHRNTVNAKQVVDEIEALGRQSLAVQADVTNAVAVQQMVQVAQQQLQLPVTVLVNNASGAINPEPFLESDWTSIERHFQVQVGGAFNCAQAVIPAMVEVGKGRIISIGSTVSRNIPPKHWTGNTLAKTSLAALTRSLAIEFGPKGICVNTVTPGMTETDMIADISPRQQQIAAMQTPLRRLALPEDVACVVMMLCSPAGNYITGDDIPVNGGAVMY
ncbi:SDR family oxidoreductase [bacterium]|nr:SDR family oxidoreductase [bacterium]